MGRMFRRGEVRRREVVGRVVDSLPPNPKGPSNNLWSSWGHKYLCDH